MTFPGLKSIVPTVVMLLLVGAEGCATRVAPESSTLQSLDPAKGAPGSDGATVWFNALDLGIEGQGWSNLRHPYDRLPAEAEGAVPDAVWSLSHHSAGLCVRFVTDSPNIGARWSLRSDRLAMNHMPATGVSGLDLYVRANGSRQGVATPCPSYSSCQWGWVGVGIPSKVEGNESVMLSGAPEGTHEFRLYLPLYNGVEKLEIGVKSGALIAKAPAYTGDRSKPILFWGTSILQGGCASRPGMAYPSIIGRRMQCPTINLGFSGNGKMDPPLVALIARLDVAAYVIDCVPNMDPKLIAERTEPLVKTLRNAHPATPIVLVENVPYQQGWFAPAKRDAYVNKNAALKAAYDRLIAQGMKRLYYIPCGQLLGSDHEATVDGTHATDLGFLRMADAIEPVLRRVISGPRGGR